MLQQIGRQSRLDHRSAVAIHASESGRHRADLMRQRRHRGRKRRPIYIEGGQLLADKEAAAGTSLALQALRQGIEDRRNPGRRFLRRLLVIAVLLDHRTHQRASAAAAFTAERPLKHHQAAQPAQTILAANLITMSEHGNPILDIFGDQPRLRRQALEQIKLIVPDIARTLIIPDDRRRAGLRGPLLEFLVDPADLLGNRYEGKFLDETDGFGRFAPRAGAARRQHDSKPRHRPRLAYLDVIHTGTPYFVRSGVQEARSYTPRSLRLTRPESIQRVIAAKISPERLSPTPRTERTSEAVKRLGNCSSTARQSVRPPVAGPPFFAAAVPASPLIAANCCSCLRSSFNSDSALRISLRSRLSAVIACLRTVSKAEVSRRGISSLLPSKQMSTTWGLIQSTSESLRSPKANSRN